MINAQEKQSDKDERDKNKREEQQTQKEKDRKKEKLKPRKGFVFKGGIWGAGGKFDPGLQEKYRMDDLFNGFNIGFYNMDWGKGNETNFLNPVGLDYYIDEVGPGFVLYL